MSDFGAIIFLIATLLVMGSFAFGAWSAAPWVPTRARQLRFLAEILPLKPGSIFYDLGCGDGMVLFGMAAAYPEAKVRGYDVALVPVLFANIRKLFGGRIYRNVRVGWRNLFRAPIKDADVVFVFLLSSCYEKLMRRLRTEVRDDCMVVCEGWPLPGIEAVRVEKREGLLPFYFYEGRQLRGEVKK
jgi:SAM-dependent methyltransferase